MRGYRVGCLGAGLSVLFAVYPAPSGLAADAKDVPALADIAEDSTVDLGSSGVLHLFTARLASGTRADPGSIRSALIVIHGHPRDANRVLLAGAGAAQQAGRASDTVVLAPLFQVSRSDARRCRFPGNPTARPGDAVWTCASWMEGGKTDDGGISAFKALDRIIADIPRSWPGVRTVTVAGFSAGAQFVQRYIGFARPTDGVRVRYVVSDPGTWLYFDAQRPTPLIDGKPTDWARCQDGSCAFGWKDPGGDVASACPQANAWKYGTENLPADLAASARQARARYTAADVTYLEGSLDSGDRRGAFYKILDKSCAADLQGPSRLERGLAYSDYAKRALAADHKLFVAPGCAHDITCVFASKVALDVLFPR